MPEMMVVATDKHHGSHTIYEPRVQTANPNSVGRGAQGPIPRPIEPWI